MEFPCTEKNARDCSRTSFLSVVLFAFGNGEGNSVVHRLDIVRRRFFRRDRSRACRPFDSGVGRRAAYGRISQIDRRRFATGNRVGLAGDNVEFQISVGAFDHRRRVTFSDRQRHCGIDIVVIARRDAETERAPTGRHAGGVALGEVRPNVIDARFQRHFIVVVHVAETLRRADRRAVFAFKDEALVIGGSSDISGMADMAPIVVFEVVILRFGYDEFEVVVQMLFIGRRTGNREFRTALAFDRSQFD